MAKVLIVVPDPDRPGVVKLIEQSAHYIGEDHGVVSVKPEEGSDDIVFYGPGAWHSFTRSDRPLIVQTSTGSEVPDVEESDIEATGGA
jgi:hypothetical protein